MAAKCKCGGRFIFSSYVKEADPINAGRWECKSCSKSFLQRRRKPKLPKTKQVNSSSGSTFNPLQAGIAIAEYIRSLEDQVAELRSCVSDRDALQTQVYSLQERLNELKLSNTNLIHIPIGRGK